MNQLNALSNRSLSASSTMRAAQIQGIFYAAIITVYRGSVMNFLEPNNPALKQAFRTVAIVSSVAASSALLVATAPIWVTAAAALFICDKQNPFFVNKRYGGINQDGKQDEIDLVRLQTMKLNPQTGEREVTPVGKLARAVNADLYLSLLTPITQPDKMLLVGAVYAEPHKVIKPAENPTEKHHVPADLLPQKTSEAYREQFVGMRAGWATPTKTVQAYDGSGTINTSDPTHIPQAIEVVGAFKEDYAKRGPAAAVQLLWTYATNELLGGKGHTVQVDPTAFRKSAAASNVAPRPPSRQSHNADSGNRPHGP